MSRCRCVCRNNHIYNTSQEYFDEYSKYFEEHIKRKIEYGEIRIVKKDFIEFFGIENNNSKDFEWNFTVWERIKNILTKEKR